MSTFEISIISIIIAFLGTILIPLLISIFRNRYEMIKELQNKINLLNFIKADITVLKEVHSELAESTPVSQILDNLRKRAEAVNLTGYSEFIASLKENQHLLVNMHNNFFAGFDNHICKEIGSLSSDIAEKVIKFYDYAKTFCDTSKNYIEGLKALEKFYGFNLEEDLKNGLQQLKTLYEKTEEERESILQALKKEKERLEEEKSKIKFWRALKLSF